MLFRPNFCANCGEKIERSDWGILTSRRFCQVCESQFKGPDLIPRVLVCFGLIIGLIGIGGYLKSGSNASESQLSKLPRKVTEQSMSVAQAAPKAPQTEQVGTVNTAAAAVPEVQNTAALRKTEMSRMPEMQKLAKPQVEGISEVYFCGAQTAKGTPCKHRVKGNVRCFQHAGMPAMLPAGKLRIN